ncbi:MAG: type II toxin-antitoxin system PemK/MazF family toxin [Chloroflexota bacterium]|nr:type II toxin-antitoxin system PemK/MazF family toxin [Chloroflexota bacterium]
MSALQAGDVVTIDFSGVKGIKRRPVIVVSSSTYHQHRPDVIVGIVTSQVQKATTPTDYVLKDWAEAGLHRLSAFRTFLATLPSTAATPIGHCSKRDWQGITNCLKKAVQIKVE